MHKKEILVFSIFGLLNVLTRLVEGINYSNFTSLGMEIDRVQKSNKPLAGQLYGQMKVLNHYDNIATDIFRVCAFFSCCISDGILHMDFLIRSTS